MLTGKNAPSNKIHVGQIGCGRIANDMDMPGILKHDRARIVAVCDLDSKRAGRTPRPASRGTMPKKRQAETRSPSRPTAITASCSKTRHMDAIAVSTPDHWHAEPVIAAALAGKDIYVQKPLAMTLAEGRAVSDTVRARKRAFQIGSQQRSDRPFRLPCELVRNGRIGKLHTVKIGLPDGPRRRRCSRTCLFPPTSTTTCGSAATPQSPYTENRVHPQNSIYVTGPAGSASSPIASA